MPILEIDGPTLGLDPLARETIWERLQELKANLGMTILITTHYMDEVSRLCDRIGIMHRGVLAALGSPADLERSLGRGHATLDDVFEWYAGGECESSSGFRETQERGKSGAGWDSPAPSQNPRAGLPRFVAKTAAIAQVEAWKIRRDPTELFTRALQHLHRKS